MIEARGTCSKEFRLISIRTDKDVLFGVHFLRRLLRVFQWKIKNICNFIFRTFCSLFGGFASRASHNLIFLLYSWQQQQQIRIIYMSDMRNRFPLYSIFVSDTSPDEIVSFKMYFQFIHSYFMCIIISLYVCRMSHIMHSPQICTFCKL